MENNYFIWTDHSILYTFTAFGYKIPLRYYGLLFMGAFLFGFRYMLTVYRLEKKPVVNLDSLLNHMLIGTILGARLGHCLFYDPSYFLSNPLEILYVWKGGLASHGGLIGILLALYIYSKKHPEEPYMWLLDRLTVPAVFGAFLIRIGNFFNSEIVGIQTDVPWAIIFTEVDRGQIHSNVPRHPSMLYEAVCYLFIFFLLAILYRKQKENLPKGLSLGLLFTLVFTARFLIEFTKTKQENFNLGTMNMGHLLSIPFIIIGIYIIFKANKNKIETTKSTQ